MSSKSIFVPAIAVILVLQLAAAAAAVAAFEIVNCASNKGPDANLLSLNIDTCPDASGERCNFIKGKNATMTLDLEPVKEFSQANIIIKAKIGAIYIPFKLAGPVDACGHYGLDCPTKVGQKQQMVISLPVLRLYPSIKTTVRFELNDESKKPIVCLEFPVQLKSE